MSAGDPVRLAPGKLPRDYHCKCRYCKAYMGELRPEDGSYYSRLERRQYYSPVEKGKGGHIAKTPLHIARWAVQRFTKEGDWVLDPTIGAGTTAVEALTQGRSVAGMELEFGDIVEENIRAGLKISPNVRGQMPEAKFARGDARGIEAFLKKTDPSKKKRAFALVVNNPPYSGDVSMPSPKGKLRGKEYNKDLPNLAFLKEGEEYWETMQKIYSSCVDRLSKGGRFVVGVKDMMRNKQPFLLHQMFCEIMSEIGGLEFEGTALLKHYPSTLFLNTYEKFYGVVPPLYQTISVFRKT